MEQKAAQRPLTAGQVAVLFGCSAESVRRWADDGKLRSFRTPGGQRRFHRADVDAFIEAQAS